MAQKNKALEKEIKEMIKSLNKQTGAKLSYTNLYDDIKSALEPHMASGGRFGGETTAEQFDTALSRVRLYCQENGIIYE